jgi:hypothetical protein
MAAFETIKKLAKKATDWSRPKKATLELVRPRKPHAFRFKEVVKGELPMVDPWSDRTSKQSGCWIF